MATGLKISRRPVLVIMAMVGFVSTTPAWAEGAAVPAPIPSPQPIADILLGRTPVAVPFLRSTELADAELAQLRGGFEADSKVTVPFGLDLHWSSRLNGKETSSLTLGNGGNPSQTVQVNSQNINFGAINQVTSTMTNGTSDRTFLTNSGIVTVIQNTRPNITLQALQALQINITGLKGIVTNQAHTASRPPTIFH
jgi:hypothetical protein